MQTPSTPHQPQQPQVTPVPQFSFVHEPTLPAFNPSMAPPSAPYRWICVPDTPAILNGRMTPAAAPMQPLQPPPQRIEIARDEASIRQSKKELSTDAFSRIPKLSEGEEEYFKWLAPVEKYLETGYDSTGASFMKLLKTLDGKALLLVKGLNSMNDDVLDLMMATLKRHFGNTSLLNRTLRARLEAKTEVKWGSVPIAQHVAKVR